MQSVPPIQPSPSGHLASQLPPQSRPLSVPLMAPSAQVAAWQMPAPQTRLTQSRPSLHGRPSLQPRQAGPPQSVSLSRPFSTPSSQAPTGALTKAYSGYEHD